MFYYPQLRHGVIEEYQIYDNYPNMTKKRFYKGVRINSLGFPISGVVDTRTHQKRTKRIFHDTFTANFQKDMPKDLIVMYDIPHEQKKERDWFRRHLKRFNYIMIQKSIWVGPSPLPKDFVEYVRSIRLHDKVKTFQLAKPYREADNNF